MFRAGIPDTQLRYDQVNSPEEDERLILWSSRLVGYGVKLVDNNGTNLLEIIWKVHRAIMVIGKGRLSLRLALA